MAKSIEEMNSACISIVRKMQSGIATEDEILYLWKETCTYLKRGIETRAYMSRQDPSMAKEDIEQELFIRIPTWAKTFRTEMTSWGQWARSCWWRWANNHSKHHARHRPFHWLSTDAAAVPERIPDENKYAVKEQAWKDMLDFMTNKLVMEDPEYKEYFTRYMYYRVYMDMSKRGSTKAANQGKKKYSVESYRQWEIQFLEFYRLYNLEQ